MTLQKEKIEELLVLYGDMVLRVAYTYLKSKSDAEDIVQDVFLHIMEKCPEFNDDKHEKAWIIRVTVNMCKNKLNLFWNRNKCPIDDIKIFPHMTAMIQTGMC